MGTIIYLGAYLAMAVAMGAMFWQGNGIDRLVANQQRMQPVIDSARQLTCNDFQYEKAQQSFATADQALSADSEIAQTYPGGGFTVRFDYAQQQQAIAYLHQQIGNLCRTNAANNPYGPARNLTLVWAKGINSPTAGGTSSGSSTNTTGGGNTGVGNTGGGGGGGGGGTGGGGGGTTVGGSTGAGSTGGSTTGGGTTGGGTTGGGTTGGGTTGGGTTGGGTTGGGTAGAGTTGGGTTGSP